MGLTKPSLKNTSKKIFAVLKRGQDSVAPFAVPGQRCPRLHALLEPISLIEGEYVENSAPRVARNLVA